MGFEPASIYVLGSAAPVGHSRGHVSALHGGLGKFLPVVVSPGHRYYEEINYVLTYRQDLQD